MMEDLNLTPKMSHWDIPFALAHRFKGIHLGLGINFGQSIGIETSCGFYSNLGC